MFFFWCKITTAHWRWPYTIFSICCTIIMTVPKKELSETLPLRLVSFSMSYQANAYSALPLLPSTSIILCLYKSIIYSRALPQY